MWQITEKLFLGNKDDARDRAALTDAGITHIVNCAFEVGDDFPDDFKYHRLDFCDPDLRFLDEVAGAFPFIDEGLASGSVLVHCNEGKSRAPAVTAAYLRECGYTTQRAIGFVEEKGQAAMHMIFKDMLMGYW